MLILNPTLSIRKAHASTRPYPMRGQSKTYVGILRRCSPVASSISARDPALLKLVNDVRARAPRYGSLKRALMQYLVTDRTLADIAADHSCTFAALMYWAGKLQLPGRRRGRRVLLAPSADDRRVIALFRKYGAVEAARRAAKSRARVYQVLSRWAPDLKRPWHSRNAVRQQPPKRHAARCEVIAFRLTHDEWRALQATTLPSSASNLSANERAREMVLRFIGTPVGSGRDTNQDFANPSPRVPNNKISDFIDQNTA